MGGKRHNKDIAFDHGVSVRTVQRHLKRHRETGGFSPGAFVSGRPQVLKSADVDFIEALVEQTPDIYLSEIQDAVNRVCEIDVCLATIWHALKRRGFVREKVSRVSSARDDADRAAYRVYAATHFRAEQLVFMSARATETLPDVGWRRHVSGNTRVGAMYISRVSNTLCSRLFPSTAYSTLLPSLAPSRVRISTASSTLFSIAWTLSPCRTPSSSWTTRQSTSRRTFRIESKHAA